MPHTSEPFICYGESFPIAKDLAMDAALPRRTLSEIFGPSHSRPVATPRRPMARDENTEETEMDYTKVLAFLREKLDPDDLKEVAGMLGVEVDTASMDRRRGGASDAALDVDRNRLHDRYRAGHISDAKYAEGIRAINARRGSASHAQDGRSVVSPLDKLEAEFPHMNRLKR